MFTNTQTYNFVFPEPTLQGENLSKTILHVSHYHLRGQMSKAPKKICAGSSNATSSSRFCKSVGDSAQWKKFVCNTWQYRGIHGNTRVNMASSTTGQDKPNPTL